MMISRLLQYMSCNTTSIKMNDFINSTNYAYTISSVGQWSWFDYYISDGRILKIFSVERFGICLEFNFPLNFLIA